MIKLRYALAAACVLALATSAQAGGHGGGHYGGGHYGFSSHSRSYSGDHCVHSYYRRNGTFVQGYHATNPNGTRNDNYSTRGNVNPYTGVAGTKPRDGE